MKNTGIKIETVKEANDRGQEGFRITKIQALERKELPFLYLDGERESVYFSHFHPDNSPHRHNTLYLRKGSDKIYVDGWDGVKLDRFYSVENMEEINGHIRAAGQHLTEVNAKLAKKRTAWHGKTVFIDGVEQGQTNPDNSKATSKTKNTNTDIPIPLARLIARLWGEDRLLYRNAKGHIKPLKFAE